MCSTDRKEILHMSRQLNCRDMCKILLWLGEYILKQSTAYFGRISNSIKISLVGRATDLLGMLWLSYGNCAEHSEILWLSITKLIIYLTWKFYELKFNPNVDNFFNTQWLAHSLWPGEAIHVWVFIHLSVRSECCCPGTVNISNGNLETTKQICGIQ